MHAAIHPLTPGSPAYAIAKIGAVGGIIALRVAMSRRAKRSAEPDGEHEPADERPAPHPVSTRKAQRRSRKRRRQAAD